MVNASIYQGSVRVVDRRVVGADWVQQPARSAHGPARIVFGSAKGGVGRSTALCVLASHLSGRGRRVLAVDMDLEAPGLGNMLLPGNTLPKFGLLDLLVENQFGDLDDQFYSDIVGASWLGGGRGRVDVIPALGQRSTRNPGNVLAKIGRAYLDDPKPGGRSASFGEQIREFIDRFSDALRYDAILIDARAGMHETTAVAMIGLGAQLYLFGIDQPQTFTAYRALISHLNALPIDKADDWRDRLQFIQAKAPLSQSRRLRFSHAIDDLLRECLWRPLPSPENAVKLSELKDTFEVEWDPATPPTNIALSDDLAGSVVAIGEDEQFRAFAPVVERDALSEAAYRAAYGAFLDVAESFIDSNGGSERLPRE